MPRGPAGMESLRSVVWFSSQSGLGQRTHPYQPHQLRLLLQAQHLPFPGPEGPHPSPRGLAPLAS